MIVLVLVARSVSPSDFGAFSIAVETYLVTVFIGRGMASDVLVTAHAADAPEALRRAVAAGTSVILATGTLCGLVVAAAGSLTHGLLASHLLVLGLLLPGLLIQDLARAVFIVRLQPLGAFALDALWLVAEIPVLLVGSHLGASGPVLLVLWGVCGVVAGLAGIVSARLRPAGLAETRAWLLRHLRLWPYFLAENLVFRATILAVMVGLTLTAGLDGVAGLRAATAIFAPVAVLGRGIVVVSVPELARKTADPADVRRGVRRLEWMLTPLPLILAALLLAAPESVGRALFGASWVLAEPLLLLTAISAAASMYAIAIAVGLRAFQAGRAGFSARAVVAVLAVAAALFGGWLDGQYGAALALAISSPVQSLIWWWQLHRISRAAESSLGSSPNDPSNPYDRVATLGGRRLKGPA